MQLDVEVSPSAFVRAQLEVECTCANCTGEPKNDVEIFSYGALTNLA